MDTSYTRRLRSSRRCGMFRDSWSQWLHPTLGALRSSTGGKSKRPLQPFRPRVEGLENRLAPATVNLTPIADNTLYQVSAADPAQQLSNGAGEHFFVGATNQASNALRRAAI